MPHGGPHLRDYWDFDRERQIMANAGYLVVNVNFRGSSGYGQNFQHQSDGRWGSLVQQDIAEATRWAIAEGYADPEKICIYGASFGAYSAMMSAALYPDLYSCAAGFAGIYDLALMYDEGDIAQSRSGVNYLRQALGEDDASLQSQSPVHRAAEIQVPVFIAHGGEDQRAPIEHARSLEAALEQAGVEVRSQYHDSGGHGYYLESANQALYRGLLDFFDQHLKK